MSEQIKATAHLIIKDSNGVSYDLRLSYVALSLSADYTDRYFEARYKLTTQVKNEWEYLLSTDFGDNDTDIDEEVEINAIFERVLEELNGEIKKVFGGPAGQVRTGEAGIKWILENEIAVKDGIVVRNK